MRFGLSVVVAIGQAQAALIRAGDYLRAVFVVLLREETEENVDAHTLQASRFGLHVRETLHCVDAREFRNEGFCACGVDGSGIDAAGVEVADFLFGRTAGSATIGRGMLENRVERVLVFVGHDGIDAPGRIRGGDGVFCEPAANGKLKEIGARADAAIEVREREAVLRGGVSGVRGLIGGDRGTFGSEWVAIRAAGLGSSDGRNQESSDSKGQTQPQKTHRSPQFVDRTIYAGKHSMVCVCYRQGRYLNQL